MIGRIFSVCIIVFWVVMMTLLVRQEFFPRDDDAIPVDPRLVASRVFNNDDPSTLKIFHGGSEVGSARFQVKALEESAIGSVPGSRREAARRSKYELSFEMYLRLKVLDAPAKFHLAATIFYDADYNRTWYSFRIASGERWVEMERDLASPTLIVRLREGGAPLTHTLNLEMEGAPASGSQLSLLGLDADTLMGMMSGELAAASGGKQKARLRTSQTSLRMAGQMVAAYLVHWRQSDQLWFKVWIGRQGQVLMVDSSLDLLMLADGFRVEEVLRSRRRPRL